MKPIIQKLWILMAMMCLSISASAYDFSVGDIYYSITDADKLTVTVTYKTTSYNSYSGKITVPASVQYNSKTYSVTSIGGAAFYGCTGLTSVAIPNSVTSIGSSAFYGCTGLTSVTIPNSVTSIGGAAFYDCSGLTSVTIPNLVTSIGIKTFYGCRGLTSVTIPNSVTSIGYEAFYGCRGLTSVPIPNSITSIGNEAFYNCSRLASVIIPNSVTLIGDEAFSNCRGLKKSAYPKTIGNPFAFGVVIEYDPEGAIVEDGFVFGPAKSSILFAPLSLSGEYTIPNSVSAIGARAFAGCDSINSVIACAVEPPLLADNSFEGLYEKANLSIPKNSLHAYLGSNWTLFNSLKIAGENSYVNTYSDGLFSYYLLPLESGAEKRTAFVKKGDYKSMTSVVIPERFTDDNSNRYYITGIGYDAFNGCTALREVKFSTRSVLSTIGDNAFKGIPISSIELPSTVTSVGNSSFYGCTGLTTVTIPNSVTSIGGAAFYGCTGLTLVTIPNSVTSIGGAAFYNCAGLTSVTIPNSVTSIGSEAFKNCSSLTSATIPNSVTSIGDYAFYNCRLASVTIPNSVTSIGTYAFRTLYVMKEFAIEEGDLPLEFGTRAFDASNLVIGRNWTCNGTGPIGAGINSVTLGKKVTQLPPNTFKYCGLTSVTIPNSVTSIGGSAFAGCTSLTSVTLSSAIDSISESAFANCKLTEVVLPPSVETIGRSAFAGNSGLNKIAMGCKVKTIEENAFQGANADCVYITAPVPPKAPTTTFTRYAGKLYVQGNAAVDAYYDASSCWDRFEGYAMSEPQSLTMEKPKLVEAIAGVQFTLKATLTPANVDLPYVFWRSTDPEKAYVDNDGKVTVLQNISAADNVEIIAETLYYNGPTAKFSFSTDASVEDIVGDTTATIDVYTLQGVQVLRNATREQFENLTGGIYIVRNGKDVKKVILL